MNKKPEVLVIIPARGNSKSIPRKNIRDFAGHPLIAYSIAAGLQSNAVTRTIVSTDDPQIAEVARQYGAEVPFMRPDEIAQDATLDFPVFYHALTWLEKNEHYTPDVVIQLRPTSPFRPYGMLDEAVAILISHPQADSIRGVVPAGQNPYKMWRIDDLGQLRALLKCDGIGEPYNAPRQDLPPVFWQTGHIDAIRPPVILEKRSMSGDCIFPLLIDPAFTVDIDTLLDWQRAEALILEGKLDIIKPESRKRSLPPKLSMVVMDFDGVLTDDRVWVDQTGMESVASSRADGLGLERLQKMTSIEPVVISKETNPVVEARCKKLHLLVYQGVDDKAGLLSKLIKEKAIPSTEVLYIGNDLNDLPCFSLVGFSVTPSDARFEVQREADKVLSAEGGRGAVRELCELLIHHYASDKGFVG